MDKKQPDIVWVDGIPCINMDERPVIEFVQFDIFFPIPKDFTELQQKKQKEFFDEVLKDIEKIFKGE